MLRAPSAQTAAPKGLRNASPLLSPSDPQFAEVLSGWVADAFEFSEPRELRRPPAGASGFSHFHATEEAGLKGEVYVGNGEIYYEYVGRNGRAEWWDIGPLSEVGVRGSPIPDPVTGVMISPGVERWAVKTATDRTADRVEPKPVDSTVAELNDLPGPHEAESPTRIPPYENRVFRLSNAHILGVKEEKDGDIHVLVSDDSAGTNTMIVEIPYPPFADGSRFAEELRATRDALHARLQVTGRMQRMDVLATLTGIGFFDRDHGQIGAARNGLELHPLLSISF